MTVMSHMNDVYQILEMRYRRRRRRRRGQCAQNKKGKWVIAFWVIRLV